MPGGYLKLVDRVIELDPQGGRYGLGQIRAEMDIHPDDWFLTCHFCDDNVMPGTLMYECCMHTLRIYLLRMGWVGEDGHDLVRTGSRGRQRPEMPRPGHRDDQDRDLPGQHQGARLRS